MEYEFCMDAALLEVPVALSGIHKINPIRKPFLKGSPIDTLLKSPGIEEGKHCIP